MKHKILKRGLDCVALAVLLSISITLCSCSRYISENQMYRYNLNLSIKEEVDFDIDANPYWEIFSDLLSGGYSTDEFNGIVNSCDLIHDSLKPTLASKRWTMESEEIEQEGYTDGGDIDLAEEHSYSLFDINGNYLGETSDYAEYRAHQLENFGIELPLEEGVESSSSNENINNKANLELVSTSIYRGKIVFKYYNFLDRLSILVLDIDTEGRVTDVQGL